MARLSVAVTFVDAEDRRATLSEAAVRVAREAGDDAALAHALAARRDAIAGPDHVDARVELSTEIVELGRRLRDPELELLGRRLRLAFLEQGDMAAVDREVTAFAAASARSVNRSTRGTCRCGEACGHSWRAASSTCCARGWSPS